MLVRLLREAAWAPAAVLVFHAVVARLGVRSSLDGLMHFLGGLAMAFFLYRAVRIAASLLGSLRPATEYVFAFALTCTVAVFWEIAEHGSDLVLRTRVQKSLSETMQDLMFGMLGAAVSLILVLIATQLRRRRGSESAPTLSAPPGPPRG